MGRLRFSPIFLLDSLKPISILVHGGAKSGLHHNIFHNGHNTCLPKTVACCFLGGIYVLGSYSALRYRRRTIHAANWIPATAMLTAREVMKVSVLALAAPSLVALPSSATATRSLSGRLGERTYAPVDILIELYSKEEMCEGPSRLMV